MWDLGLPTILAFKFKDDCFFCFSCCSRNLLSLNFSLSIFLCCIKVCFLYRSFRCWACCSLGVNISNGASTVGLRKARQNSGYSIVLLIKGIIVFRLAARPLFVIISSLGTSIVRLRSELFLEFLKPLRLDLLSDFSKLYGTLPLLLVVFRYSDLFSSNLFGWRW